jgi:hypothetical protein
MLTNLTQFPLAITLTPARGCHEGSAEVDIFSYFVDILTTGNLGSMLWSQFSAIFDNFRRKFWRNVMIKVLQNLALFWVKNGNLFPDFFGENVLKIITSVPGRRHWNAVLTFFPVAYQLHCLNKNWKFYLYAEDYFYFCSKISRAFMTRWAKNDIFTQKFIFCLTGNCFTSKLKAKTEEKFFTQAAHFLKSNCIFYCSICFQPKHHFSLTQSKVFYPKQK